MRAHLLIVAALAACDGAGGAGTNPTHNNGRPQGAEACYARHFGNISAACDFTVDCGEAMACELGDCLTCADRCTPSHCTSDADCAADFGDLCAGVEWRCEPYITSSNFRCAVHDVGEARCGNGVCEASGDEDCESCYEDCGFCAGSAPLGALCERDGDCASGTCLGGVYCSVSCSDGWDCVDHSEGSRTMSCVEALAGASELYCAIECYEGHECDDYPGSTCLLRIQGTLEKNTCVVVEHDGSCIASGGENSNVACSNGIDDDCDGYTDCIDFGCSKSPDVTVCAP